MDTKSSSILAAGLIISAAIGAYAFTAAKSLSDTISVTGSAYKDVVSDSAKWRLEISSSTGLDGLPQGNQKVKSDLAAVQKFLQDKGIGKDMITVSPVTVETRVDYNQGGAPAGYMLRQSVTVEGGDVQKITEVAGASDTLLARGAQVTTVSLEYYFSKLGDVRVELMADAMKDARRRADAITESAGGRTGALREASMGVLQVTAVNSMDVSDYGTYDTSALKKRVTAVVRAAFATR